jgi:hypothetical protein
LSSTLEQYISTTEVSVFRLIESFFLQTTFTMPSPVSVVCVGMAGKNADMLIAPHLSAVI